MGDKEKTADAKESDVTELDRVVCISHSPSHIFFDCLSPPDLKKWESLLGKKGEIVFIPEN